MAPLADNLLDTAKLQIWRTFTASRSTGNRFWKN